MMSSWWLAACRPVDQLARDKAAARQNVLTKPTGSLGQLEVLAVTLAGLQGRECPSLENVCITIFAGDHGIANAGVSAYPQEVTGQMLRNFARGGAAISVLARQLDASLEILDLGTATLAETDHLAGVKHVRIGPGTRNFLEGPAMTREQGLQALEAGHESARRAAEAGAQLFIGGEMGIGNTTSACALACALLQCPASLLVGPGTGLDAAGVQRKAEIIERGLALHAQASDDPLGVLLSFGGFEIAALVGAYIACAQQGVAVLVDGIICTVAAILAVHLNPGCAEWLLFSHCGAEPGHRHLLDVLDAKPLLQLGLRLGEGSGAALAVPLLRMACALHGEMATFAEAAVADRPA